MKLHRSTYYYESRDTEAEDQSIREEIERVIEEFPKYGYRRVTKELKRKGYPINHKRTQRIMGKYELQCKIKKRFITTTDSNHPYRKYPNLIRDLIVTRLNQIWVADMTYIRFLTGFVYLAVILDAFSRKVIGYAISKRIDRWLTLAALKMAISTRKPPKGCIHHSDQGVQYSVEDYTDYLTLHQFKISMSRKGNPYDNAMAESFMKTLKSEEVYLSEYHSYPDIVKNVFRFIESVYNQKRLHSSIGYVPRNEFEDNFIREGGFTHISKCINLN